jgi:MFS family permease
MPIVYRNYMLGVLLVIQAYNFVDRQALGLVLQNIKLDLHLSDTQLGLLTGIPFAIFYSVMGIPIARWADRGNRVTILSLSVAVWSVMVALCGKVVSFSQLMLLRAGIGVGEAGSFPPAQSLIPDYFSRAERPWAMSIYMLAGPGSTIVGLFLAGWLNEIFGWRTMFMLFGLLGSVLAPLAWLTLREPRRNSSGLAMHAKNSSSQPVETLAPPQRHLSEVVRTLLMNRTFRYILGFFSVQYFLSYGLGQFQPAFLMRSFGLNTGEIGTWYGLVFGLGGLLGIYAGGRLTVRYAANNERLQLRAAGITYGIYALASGAAYLTTNRYLFFGLLAVSTAVTNLVTGPLMAILQTLVPAQMRAVSSACIFLVANLFGTGLGPLAVGALSDGLHPWLGEESLRYALLAASPGFLIGSGFLWWASRSVTADLQIAHERGASGGSLNDL